MFLVRDTSKNRVFALKRMLVNSQTDLENCKQEISIMVGFIILDFYIFTASNLPLSLNSDKLSKQRISLGWLSHIIITVVFQKSFHRHPAMVSFKGHHTKHIGNGIYEVLLLMQHCPSK